MRLACVAVPLFPLAARLRSEPDLKGEAIAVCEGNGNAARIVAASRRAREKGVQSGQTLPQARALLPGLLARPRDHASERAAQEALLEAAEAFSPRVEDAGEGVVYVDLDGHPALRFPPLPPGEGRGEGKTAAELRLARDLIAAVEKAGLPARAGIGGSKLAARVAANLPDAPRVVPEGEEAAFLAPLALTRLAPELSIAETLERWGIRSIGDFAKLPEGEVASRLGEAGRSLHAIARGIDPRPLLPRAPPLVLTEGMDLEWPVTTLEPFLFLGRAALDRLVARLTAQALACVRLDVSLALDPDGHDARAIRLPAPTRDVKTLVTLVRLELEARPPGAPITGFAFTALPDQPRRSQLSLFGPAALSPDRLAATIARLVALLGADRVGSPRAVDGHRPERFSLAPYAPLPPPDFAPEPRRKSRGLMAVRVLRPPVPIDVIVENAEESDRPVAPSPRPPVGPSERPVSLKSVPVDGGVAIAGAVKIAAGPWSLEEGWWVQQSVDRDYWDVELSEGGLYRIYRDRKDGAWFADGIYD
jgi:protein ImuB